jgi:hypothetical protein
MFTDKELHAGIKDIDGVRWVNLDILDEIANAGEELGLEGRFIAHLRILTKHLRKINPIA